MSRFVPVFLAAILSVSHATTAAALQQEGSVYATVLDKAGIPVTALNTTDFVVREDGMEREVLHAEPAAVPVRIAVLVDTSQRMDRHINDVREALRTFFRSMQGQHDIALFEFGERPTLVVQYTRDPSLLEAGIGRLFARPGSGSYLLDAIVDAARTLRDTEAARPVIVVISAQGPEFSGRYHKTVVDELRAAHATLHSFVFDRVGAFRLNDGAREREFALAEGARLTGGRREYLLTSMALSDRLHNLSTELKNQYRVVYARPDGLFPPRTLDLTVRRSRLTVRASHVPSAFTMR